MAQVTTLNLNGVMGPVRSFAAKDPASAVTLPVSRYYVLHGQPAHHVVEGKPLLYVVNED